MLSVQEEAQRMSAVRYKRPDYDFCQDTYCRNKTRTDSFLTSCLCAGSDKLLRRITAAARSYRFLPCQKSYRLLEW